MGIKGIYAELGPGQRVALAKLAADHLENTGKPLRLAIDISIWQFQVQAAKGGSNPAIRTLFYRLARLLTLAIEPIFVFDGPRKPIFKRNKRSIQGDRTSAALAKRLIYLFGLPVHDAPGEAEAECALLQRQGVVDAVLSEDVDTIMFGCTKTLRNWTSEGRGSKTPSHVSVYSVNDEGFRRAGLNREGMVLVALMSGGDYLPEGIPRCGPKVACEAARAGFGRSLCKLKRSDTKGLEAWKEELVLQLRTNASGYFRTKHKALAIPDSFPNLDVLRYYTHPVVSDTATVEKLKAKGQWSRGVDVVAMRKFVEETFDWTYRIGADKLVRVLAPSLLVQKLMARYQRGDSLECSEEVAEREESALIHKISARRAHVSTDGIPELRVQFVPADVVGLDLSAEKEEEEVASFGRDGLALNSDDDLDEAEVAAPKKRFDPTATDALWVAEATLKLGAPLKVEDFEAVERRKLERKKPKASQRTKEGSPAKTKEGPPAKTKEGPPAKTLDGWLRTTKPSIPSKGTTPPRPDKSLRPDTSLSSSKSSSPKKALSPSKLKVPALPAARTARDRAKETSPPPQSKPQQASSPHRVSPDPPPRTAPRETTPILLSSSPAHPPTPVEASRADVKARRAGGGAGAGEAGGPRLRLPPGPPDTPPWLKEMFPDQGESPLRARQGTLDAFLGGPSRVREERSPKVKAGEQKREDGRPPKEKVKTGAKKLGAGTLFPITKRGGPPVDKPGSGRKGSRMDLEDPFVDMSGSGISVHAKGSRTSEVSVIDLTGDD